jgi:hypothetical protein
MALWHNAYRPRKWCRRVGWQLSIGSTSDRVIIESPRASPGTFSGESGLGGFTQSPLDGVVLTVGGASRPQRRSSCRHQFSWRHSAPRRGHAASTLRRYDADRRCRSMAAGAARRPALRRHARRRRWNRRRMVDPSAQPGPDHPADLPVYTWTNGCCCALRYTAQEVMPGFVQETQEFLR